MAERAAHLVDHVLPAVPIRQWVLSLPFRLRYVLAWDHALCRKVLAVHVRALRAFYRRHARRQGITDGETGAVTAIQRWGSALNLNVHFAEQAVAFSAGSRGHPPVRQQATCRSGDPTGRRVRASERAYLS